MEASPSSSEPPPPKLEDFLTRVPTDEDKLQYIAFLMTVGRFRVPQAWRHLNWVVDGFVTFFDFRVSKVVGYKKFKVIFYESLSTGFHQVSSYSAEELFGDKRFMAYYPVFVQLLQPVSKSGLYNPLSKILTILKSRGHCIWSFLEDDSKTSQWLHRATTMNYTSAGEV